MRDTILIRTIQFGLLAILFGSWWFVTHSQQRLLLLPAPELVWTQMQVLWNSGQLAAGAAFRIQHDGLQAFGPPVGTVVFRLFAQTDQPLLSPGMQLHEARNHGRSSCEEYAIEKCLMSL